MVTIPKRNKSKDNPYVLGYDNENKNYIVEFIDNKNKLHRIEISEKVYEAFDKFELEDVSQIHKFQRHIEHSEVFEETLFKKSVIKPASIEEEVENKIIYAELKYAINSLSDTQKRRLKMYYFENKTLKEIGIIEGCSAKNVFKSIEQAKVNLQKKLKN